MPLKRFESSFDALWQSSSVGKRNDIRYSLLLSVLSYRPSVAALKCGPELRFGSCHNESKTFRLETMQDGPKQIADEILRTKKLLFETEREIASTFRIQMNSPEGAEAAGLRARSEELGLFSFDGGMQSVVNG